MSGRVALALFAFICSMPVTAAAQFAGAPVTLAWDANTEPGILGYRVYVGLQPGAYAASFDNGPSTLFVFTHGVAGQRYYFAVSAYSSALVEGPRSAEVSAVVGPTTTSSTTGIVLHPAVVDGSTVMLAWGANVPVLEYLLEAGSAAGLSNLYNGSVGTATTLTATVAPGSYYVRVRARTSSFSSQLSNEVNVTVGASNEFLSCAKALRKPTRLDGAVVDGLATIEWPPVEGATSYHVQAGTARGGSDLYNGNVGATTSAQAAVPAGFRAYVRVIAVNACGQSQPSPELFLKK